MLIKDYWFLALNAALAVLALTVETRPAFAQRAAENAVAQADDAFGTSVGNERVGLYSPRNVRGFSPTAAGNVRIEGLYFDQVTNLNSRLEESSRIRVGIAAQGYAFPAPTGVVDYLLRKPGNTAQLTSLSEVDNRGKTTLELDGAIPVIGETLSVGAGLGFYRGVFVDGGSNWENNEGVTMRWTPAPNIELLPFWSRSDTYHGKNSPVYIPNGSFLPQPFPNGHFTGPDWALNRRFEINYGGLAHWGIAQGWDMRAGIFRSIEKKLTQDFVLYDGSQRAGRWRSECLFRSALDRRRRPAANCGWNAPLPKARAPIARFCLCGCGIATTPMMAPALPILGRWLSISI